MSSGGVIGEIEGCKIGNSYVYVTVTNCVGANTSITTASTDTSTDKVGSFIGTMYGGSTNVRVGACNFTVTQTELDFIGRYGAGNLKYNYYVYGPAKTSASGTNVVDVLKKEMGAIDVKLLSTQKFGEQTLTPSSFKLTPTTWTTVQGVAYPLPSGLVAHGEEYYK